MGTAGTASADALHLKRSPIRYMSAPLRVPLRTRAQGDNPSQSKAATCAVHTTGTQFPDGLMRAGVRKTNTCKGRAGVNRNTSGYGTHQCISANRLVSACGDGTQGKEMGRMIDLMPTSWPPVKERKTGCPCPWAVTQWDETEVDLRIEPHKHQGAI